tara:strand:- start:1148 stop:1546 length:399 start_codon:yes stop_codon:yes gene_type:complete
MSRNSIGLSYPIRLGQDGFFETNVDTISQLKSNIKTLFSTKIGERRFNNEFGSELHNFLFEQQDFDINSDLIKDIVQRDVNKFLNGVIVDNVNVILSENQPNNTTNKIFISIIFTYRQQQSSVDLTVTTPNI